MKLSAQTERGIWCTLFDSIPTSLLSTCPFACSPKFLPGTYVGLGVLIPAVSMGGTHDLDSSNECSLSRSSPCSLQ